MLDRIGEPRAPVTIALVGMKLHDAYLRARGLKHAGVRRGAAVRVQWVDAENMSYEEAAELLEGVDGVLVPGGSGSRGWQDPRPPGRARAEIPYLAGICLGMHVAVSEFAQRLRARRRQLDRDRPETCRTW